MKVEYVSLASATQRVNWLKRFLQYLVDIVEKIVLLLIYYDNKVTISSTKDPKFHSKTKHNDIKYHYVGI